MRMRDPLFSETMLSRLATGAAKHFVCFPLILIATSETQQETMFAQQCFLV